MQSEFEMRLSVIDKLQPLLLIISMAIGLFIYNVSPSYSKIAINVVSIGIFIVITIVMSSASISGIAKSFMKLKLIVVAIALNFIFIPIYAWILSFYTSFGISEIYAGLMLYFLTPCIGWYLIFTELAGGDVEAGVVLLIWNLLLQIALLPLYAYIFLSIAISVNAYNIFVNAVIYLILPFIISRFLRFIPLDIGNTNVYRSLQYIKTAILMIVIASMFASQAEALYRNIYALAIIVLPVTIFFISIPAIDYILAKKLRLSYREYALLTFTTTARNSEASLAIAATVFPNTLIPLVVAIAPSLELPLLTLILRILLSIKEHYR